MNHDLSNMVQIMIALVAEDQIDQKKLESWLYKISYALKIYSGIYSDSSLTDIIDLIEEFNCQSIDFEKRCEEVPDFIKKIISLYCLWSCNEIKIVLSENKLVLYTAYKPQRIKKKIIDQLILENNLSIEMGEGEMHMKW